MEGHRTPNIHAMNDVVREINDKQKSTRFTKGRKRVSQDSLSE